LSSLAPTDSFNLATCDVECQWAFDKPVPAEPANIETARGKLSSRVSLGWSDLEKALDSAFQQSDATTQIVYVGDGIVTTGAVEPAEFAQRIGQRHAQAAGIVHAVAVSSRYEDAVMKAMASLGSGSFRRLTGDTSPAVAARELLAELVQPATRIAKVEFPGLLTARIYPAELPPLVTGTQQILLGRYLPPTDKKPSEAIVTLQRGDKVWALKAPISLARAAEGNEFIPRLWARHHLDALLQQGASPIIRDEIIALSEEFHIMTPYTSLLVLETDADRERFGVKKRFLMRDGERFFAEGRDQANLDLLQQQMRAAGDWRIRQRTRVLSEFQSLGRDMELPVFGDLPGDQRSRLWPRDSDGWLEVDFSEHGEALYRQGRPFGVHSDFGVGGMGGMGGMAAGGYFGGSLSSSSEGLGALRDESLRAEPSYHYNRLLEEEDDLLPEISEPYPGLSGPPQLVDHVSLVAKSIAVNDGESRQTADLDNEYGSRAVQLRDPTSDTYGSEATLRRTLFGPSWRDGASGASLAGPRPKATPLFEIVPNYELIPVPQPVRELLSMWPEDVQEVMRGVLAEVPLPTGANTCEFRSTYYSPDEDTEQMLPRVSMTALAAAGKWLAVVEAKSDDVRVDVCEGPVRQWYSKAFLCGHARPSVELERSTWPLIRNPLDVHDYAHCEAEIVESHDAIAVVRLTDRREFDSTLQLEVDRQRAVLLSVKEYWAGELSQSTTYSDFVQYDGAWWPTQIETRDQQGAVDFRVVRELTSLDAATWATRWQSELAERDKALIVTTPLPSLQAARSAIDRGQATWQDPFTLLVDAYRWQQWDRALEHLHSMEAMVTDKPGFMWIRHAVLQAARRQEDLRKLLMQEATELVASSKQLDRQLDFCQTQRLQNDARGVMDPQGRMLLLSALEPVIQAVLPADEARQYLLEGRADLLKEAGDRERLLSCLKELADEVTDRFWARSRLIDQLLEDRDTEAAVNYLKQWADSSAGKNDGVWDDVWEQWADVYRSQERYPELVEHLASWVAKDPVDWDVYGEYLAALVKTDQSERADQLARQWLADGCQPGWDAPSAEVRLESAIDYALGIGTEPNQETYDPQWNEPLAALVRFHLEQPQRASFLDEIMDPDRRGFAGSDAARQLRQELLQRLMEQAGSLPVRQVEKLAEWTAAEQTVEQRTTVIASLRNRWNQEARSGLKHRLGGVLEELQAADGEDELLEFLRAQVATSTPVWRAEYVERLFDHLLEIRWTAEREQEAFRLLLQLTSSYGPTVTLKTQSQWLPHLCDTMAGKRYRESMAQVGDAAAKSRLEMRDLMNTNVWQARRGLVERLEQVMPEAPELFRPFLIAEWASWQTWTGENLDLVEQRCWELLGAQPPYLATEDVAMDELRERPLRRALMILLNLASRRSARPESVNRLLAYIDLGIQKDDGTSAGWKQVKCDLLTALDRSDELVANLRAWIADDDLDADLWRLLLGHALAEHGSLSEAISLLSDLRQRGRLGAEDLWELSNWYLVGDQREDYMQARVESFALRSEWELRNSVERSVAVWEIEGSRALTLRDSFDSPLEGNRLSSQASNGQTQIEEFHLQLFAALFRKAEKPSTYLEGLRRAYRITRDFRLLNGLADAVMGQSAERVYDCLGNVGPVIAEVEEEATVDSLVAHISAVRNRAVTDVDHLALDMLEVLIERRAVEQKNQPGPHAARALAALQRIAQSQRVPGERPQLAGFLASLGAISDQALADEQFRQLKSLQESTEAGSAERMDVSVKLAAAYWAYQRWTDAIDLLQAVIKECQQTHSDAVPIYAQDAVAAYVQYLLEQRQFASAEEELRQLAEHPVHAGQGYWFDEQLDQAYEKAMTHGGQVSLGRGKDLFVPLTQRLKQKLQHPDLEHRSAALEQLLSVYFAAHELGIESAASDLIAFSREPLLAALTLRLGDYHDVVSSVAYVITEVAGDREMLTFLIWSLEHEPQWLANSTDNGWRCHATAMADARVRVWDLGDLEQPLLTMVLRELRRDLLDRDFRNTSFFCDSRYDSYWSKKRDDFLRVAEGVFAESTKDPETQLFAARYAAEDLKCFGPGIDMLTTLFQAGTLDQEWRQTLASWLQTVERFDESIPILHTLVDERPDDVDAGCLLLRALWKTSRVEECRERVLQLEVSVRESTRNKLDSLKQPLDKLASSSLECQLYDVAARLYGEVIALHKQAETRIESGDDDLADYCAALAESLAALDRTEEAVDAACEAMVSGSRGQESQRKTFFVLLEVLRRVGDLSGFIAQLDRESQQTGLDKPAVRKALAIVLSERESWQPAIKQLRAASWLQPDDPELWARQVKCFDVLSDKQAAVEALLRQLELQPRDIELCRDLAQRYDELGETAEAERALTTMVELLPQEAESHTMLAEIRQGQDRWADAAVHWQRVAKLRELEPTGLINLAAIQIRLEQWETARTTINQIKSRQWPDRFDSVSEDVERLERELEGRE
jgi:predicted Zn-dependent protease